MAINNQFKELTILLVLSLLFSCSENIELEMPVLDINPYENIDFSSVVYVTSSTHEHCRDQMRFEAAWNRGLRVINPVHYTPSAPSYPLNGWNNVFIDWDESMDLNSLKIMKDSGRILNFTDAKGNYINIDSIVSLPNAEHTFSAFDFHICAIGSTWSSHGWSRPGFKILDDDTPVNFRLNNPIYTPEMVFDSLTKNTLHDKVFITYNHPISISETRKNLNKFRGRINALEIFNGSLNDLLNRHIKSVNDRLLREGYRFWITAVLDWTGVQPQDLGLSVLILPEFYGTLDRVEKEKLILDSFIRGHFYCSGKNSFYLKRFSVNDTEVEVELSENVRYIKVISNMGERTFFNTSTVEISLEPGTRYMRIEAYKENMDFLFTQPVFFK